MADEGEIEPAADLGATPILPDRSFGSDFEAIVEILPPRVGVGVEVVFFDQFSQQRLADYGMVLSHLYTADDQLIFRTIYVLLSPDALSERREEYLERLIATHARRLPDGQRVPDRAALERVFRIVELQDFSTGAVLTEIGRAQRESVIIIGNAHLFRSPDIVRDPEAASGLDGFWVPHLVALLTGAASIARETECFVLFDVSMHMPAEEVLRQSIMDIEGVGVTAISSREATQEFDEIGAAIAGFGERIEAGDMTAILARIDSLASVSETQKEVLSIQVLARGALYEPAVQRMRKVLAGLMKDGQGELLLKFARIAHLGSDEDLAGEILARAVETLRAQEAIEDAMLLAFDLDLHEIYARCVDTLRVQFPHSSAVDEQIFRKHLFSGEYSDALALLDAGRAGVGVDGDTFYRRLFEVLDVEGEPPYREILDIFESSDGYGRESAALLSSHDAERRQFPVDGLFLAAAVSPFSSRAADAARLMVRHMKAIFALAGAQEQNVTVRFLDWYLSYLSRHPGDHRARHRLVNVLSPTIAGLSGMGVLLWVFNNNFRRPAIDSEWQTLRAAASNTQFERFLDGALVWLRQNRNLVIGQTTLPDELLTQPAEMLYPRMMHMLEAAANNLGDPDAVQSYMMLCCIAMGVARATGHPVEEISVLRLVGSRLAVSGRQQQARDLAEVALALGQKSDLHARFAWVAFADIYHRLNHHLEAMAAILCGIVYRDPISNEQAWYEAEIVSRIARDSNQYGLANRAISSGQENLKAAGLADTQQHRVLILHLTMKFRELVRPLSEADLTALIGELVGCCELAEKANDDPTPPAMLLGQAIRLAERNGFDVSEGARRCFAHVVETIPEPLKSFTILIGALAPSFDDFHRLVQGAEASRSARNAGFDFTNLTILADHVLETAAVRANPAQALYCIELSADRGTDFRLEGAERESALPLPATPEVMRDWVLGLSCAGVEVVGLGISDSRELVRVCTFDSVLQSAEAEPEQVFSFGRFRKWKSEFPYGFKDEAVNVYAEMANLGLSAIPSRRLLFIMDAELQVLTLNLLMVQNELLGRGHAAALVPSMSWLVEAQARQDVRTGRRCAWIPLEFGGDGTLGMVAARLRPALEEYGFSVDEAGEVPDNLGKSDIAVIVAHGGVHDRERFFSIISDDGEARFHADALANSLAESRLVILFVCSAGRMDKDLASNTTVGLTKQLLNNGCSTVIASPWPLNSSVPAHWLPAFLASWLGRGTAAIDACFIANQAVLHGLGDVPPNWLAMSIFGDPLLKAA